MEKTSDTLAADTPQLRERLADLERQRELAEARKDGIDREILALRAQLAPVLADERRQTAVERARDPREFADLLGDPSYERDYEFTAKEEDEARRDAYRTRTSEAERAESDVRRLEAEFADVRRLQAEGPARAEQLRGVVRAVDASLGARFANLFSGQRETARKELEGLESRLAASHGELNRVAAALVAARARAEEWHPNEAYSADLHAEDVASEGLVPRTAATALLSYSAGGRRSPSTVTLHLPNAADGGDYTRTLTLELEGSELEDFLALVGKDVPSAQGSFGTVGENVEYAMDFEDEVVPFPLERLEGGAVRIPRIVWERFKAHVVG